MPYPNEHACRLINPKDVDPDSYTSGTRTSQGKLYRILFAIKKGESKRSEQAYRYNKKQWTAEQARAHCGRHGGSFEAAVSKDNLNLEIIRKDREKQIIYGIVWTPGFVDAAGDYVEKEDIENAAHDYLINCRKLKLSHQVDIELVADLVESYLMPIDITLNKQKIKEGTWIVGIKIWDTGLWSEIEKSITGLSMGFRDISEDE